MAILSEIKAGFDLIEKTDSYKDYCEESNDFIKNEIKKKGFEIYG